MGDKDLILPNLSISSPLTEEGLWTREWQQFLRNLQAYATGVRNLNLTAKTGAFTVDKFDEHVVCNTSGGAFTVTLLADPREGKTLTIVLETAGNNLTVDGNGNNINGDSTVTMSDAGDAMQLIFNGTQWNIK